jgi:hypothetical protein
VSARLERPTRVLMGEWRHRAMILRAVAAWWPLLAPVAVWWAVGTFRYVAVVVLAAVAGWCQYRGLLLSPLRRAWWRTMWWADARSAGLVVVADPSLNATAEKGGRMAVGLELAPPLLRVRVARSSRVLLVKALPGQSFDDFERAVPMLAHRWGCEVAVAEHPRRRRCVLIEVVNSRALAEPIEHPAR